MKVVLRKFMIFCLMVMIAGTSVKSVQAAEQGSFTILKTVTILEATEAKREPKDDAEVFEVFESGTDVLVIEEINEEWYSIFYKGEVVYIKKTIAADKIVYGEETEELDEEFSQMGYESTLLVEEIEMAKAESKKSIVWGVVIGVLVIAILGVGITQGIMAKKRGEDED